MSQEDNNNIYILEEEEEKEIDDSPYNYASLKEVPNEDGNEEKTSERGAFSYLFRIMFNPVEGWKLLRRERVSTERLQSGCFYPILAFLAVSKFADYFYSVNIGLSQIITASVISFVAFFLGYFCIQLIMSWILPRDMAQKFEESFGKQYTIIALSTLAMFTVLTNLLPMIWPILIFLPIWTLYLMFKGVKFFHFQSQQEMKFFVLAGAAVIFIPLLIDWALNGVLLLKI